MEGRYAKILTEGTSIRNVMLLILISTSSITKGSEVWQERAGKCYLIVDTAVAQPVAKQLCADRGAVLLEIYTSAEFRYLNRWMPSNSDEYWTGYTHNTGWETTTNLIPAELWGNDEPNFTGECARLKWEHDTTSNVSEWKLFDHLCGIQFKPLCQKNVEFQNIIDATCKALAADDELCHLTTLTVRSLVECTASCATSSLCVHLRYAPGTNTSTCMHFQDKGSFMAACQAPSGVSSPSDMDYEMSRTC